jgi:hypothetical protein
VDDCLLIGGSVVFWPHGTTWDEDREAVEFGGDFDGLPPAAVGERFTGGGGGSYSADNVSGLEGFDAEPILRCQRETGADAIVLAYPSDRTSQTSTQQSHGSAGGLARLQEDAASGAEQLASDEGLRVENRTGAPVELVFPDGDTARVAADRSLVVLRACSERLPLRAESSSGDLVAELDGPCRPRDTWVLD